MPVKVENWTETEKTTENMGHFLLCSKVPVVTFTFEPTCQIGWPKIRNKSKVKLHFFPPLC